MMVAASTLGPAGSVSGDPLDAGLTTGVYVHIPFCARHCPYCDYNVAVVPKPPWEGFTDALCRELELRSDELVGRVETLYLGGGTPSIMPPEWLARVITEWSSWASQVDEFTIELNPEHVDEERLHAWLEIGANRFSFGLQSLNAKTLKTLGRAHRPGEAMDAIKAAAASGVDHLSLDLIFGVPGQSVRDVIDDVELVSEMDGVDHLSLYELTYEPKTSFMRRLRRNELQAWDPDELAELHERVIELLEERGWSRYEVSNFSREGGASQHNQRYWRGAHCVSLGPGAVSLLRNSAELSGGALRVKNLRSYRRWIELMTTGSPELVQSHRQVEEREELSGLTLSLERVITGLRTSEGVSLHELEGRVASALHDLAATRWAPSGLVRYSDGWVQASVKGVQLADTLALELLDVLPA